MSRQRRADLAFFGALLVGLLFVFLLGPVERRIELVHENDFSGFWSGARGLVLGVDPYDPVRWPPFAATLGTQLSNVGIYGYFPWVPLALYPLALLPLETAAWIWMLAGIALAATLLRAFLRALLPGEAALHGAFGLALLVAQPAFHSVVLGQWSFVLLAALCACVLWLRAGRTTRAAVVTSVFLGKPQLFVGTAIGLALPAISHGPRRRFVAIAAALVIAIVGVSWMLLPDWWTSWTGAVAPERLGRSASITVALRDIFGPAGLAVAALLVAIGVGVALRARPGSDASLALWTCLSIAGAPYVWSYDHLLLLTPLALAAGALIARRPRAARLVAFGGVGSLLLISPLLYGLAIARHRESFSALLPVAIFILLAVALWRERAASSAGTPAGPPP